MATVQQQHGTRLRSWTKAEYYRMGELGFFRGQRVELLEGRIVVLSPQNAPHFDAVETVAATLRRYFTAGFMVRMQGPLDLGQTTEPEPDVCVVTGKQGDYRQSHPTSALLVVEVSDTSLSIVNLVGRQLEVYRAPIADPRRRSGHRYSLRADLLPTATVSPLALPQAVIPIADLLPA
jgi:Uma2 family endonuclease